MDNVYNGILRGRAILDSPGAWQTGQIRNPAEVAKSAVTGQPGDIRRSMEKSPQDRSIGSVPFDYSKLGDRGCAANAGGDEPRTDLIVANPSLVISQSPEENQEPEISIEQNTQADEAREQMQTTATPKVSLVKHNQVKALALKLMAERFSFNGKPKFTRVTPQFCEATERFLYAAIVSAIKKHPSVGKVIKEF